ncbi:MAG: hypothetical protein F4X46_10840 [Chloroflexi bacterium]|nr:hypothetical protein [Chloroflexota bacterium]
MSSAIEQLLLAPNDTLSSLRVRLTQLRGKRVLLIFPPDSDMLKRRLDLVLLQREARRNAIQLAIVAQDTSLQAHAAELNISCFASVEASQIQRWKRSRNKVFLPRYHRPRADLQPADLARIADKRGRARQNNTWRILILRAGIILLLCAVVGALVYTIAPGAVIRVQLRSQEVQTEVEIIADSQAVAVDWQRGLIPALRLRDMLQTSASIPSSGAQSIAGASATGSVTFINLRDQLLDFPAGSIVSTSAGDAVFFETSADVIVPAGIGSSVDAPIVAASGYGGRIGNVAVGAINRVAGDLVDSVTVLNLAPTAGGSDRAVQVIAAVDHARLLDIARLQLQSLAYDRMRADLSQSQVIIIESLQIAEENKDWLDYSAVVGARASQLSLTMRAVVSALAVDEKLAREILQTELAAAAPAGMALQADTVVYERGAFDFSPAKEQVRFMARGSAVAQAQLDVAALRERLAGADLDAAQSHLREHPSLVQRPPPQLSLYPRGLGRMPLLPLRIQIDIADAA